MLVGQAAHAAWLGIASRRTSATGSDPKTEAQRLATERSPSRAAVGAARYLTSTTFFQVALPPFSESVAVATEVPATSASVPQRAP